MFHKLVVAIGATAVIAAAALAPTSASAKKLNLNPNVLKSLNKNYFKHQGGHHWGHWHGGYGFGIGLVRTLADYDDCYVVRRVVELPDGSLRIRRVTVCD